MATVTYTYDLNDIDDKQAAHRAESIDRVYIALWELDNELRNITKYGSCNHGELKEGEAAGLYRARDILHEILSDNNVQIED